jgi:phosphorylcholine metabolism protein LicD
MYENTSKYIGALNDLFMEYPCESSEYWRNYGNSSAASDISPKWHFGEGAWATFEGLRVRIPENYDAYLTQKYGDWRADLPEDQRQGHHYYEIMDLEHPYTDYVEKLPGGKIKLKK